MNDYLRESFSYFGLFARMFAVKKTIVPVSVRYGKHKDQYYNYYEPEVPGSDKVIVWVHGGGWNSGSPKAFDFVGQRIAGEGYRTLSLGYRLSPKYKYPCQIIDVCKGYRHAMRYLESRGVDTSKVIIAGPSAGAHLTSIFCYNNAVRRKTGTDISNVIGYIGFGGPYSFSPDMGKTLSILLGQLFRKGYDRSKGEPVSLMDRSSIPMLLIQSRHDGLIDFSCAERFAEKAASLGIKCELYEVREKRDTHSWYTAGLFMETFAESPALAKFFSYIDEL